MSAELVCHELMSHIHILIDIFRLYELARQRLKVSAISQCNGITLHLQNPSLFRLHQKESKRRPKALGIQHRPLRVIQENINVP
jgi:hypothetical protein